jgi:hypothetical protein
MESVNSPKNSPCNKRHLQGTKKSYAKELYAILYNEPLSRRMAATQLGFDDQTYMVTQFIYDWIKEGNATVVGLIKCRRSKRFVQAITTNPDLFPESNQLRLF